MEHGDDIYRAAEVCSERFDACISGPAPAEYLVSIISAQGDYNLWCSAIKATSRGKASLDYRLRNHQDVREVVCSLLGGLTTALGRWTRRAAAIFGDAEFPVDAVDDMPESPSSTGSPASWDALSDEWSNPDSAQSQDALNMDPVMGECLHYIKTSLDQLARVSLAIRKAGNKYRFEKADAELSEDAFEEFRRHLASIILRAFPDPEARGLSAEEKMKRVSDYRRLSAVQKRLVHANILRKHRIEFITRSRKKGVRPVIGDVGLTKDIRRLGETRAPTASSVFGSQNSDVLRGQAADQPPVPDASKAAPASSVVLTAAPTATDVGSQLDVKRFLPAQTPSRVTNITRVGSTQAYPNCPKPSPDGMLICPYCDDVLPSSYAKTEQSWKAHVIQDLMPYSCFMDECETPYEMYLTTETLLAHVMDKHSSPCWTCNFCRSSGQAMGSSSIHARHDFWSAEAWEDHVKQSHSDRIKASQLPIFVELSKRSVIGPLNCPLCDFSTEAVDSKIDDHILQHLHEFSLRALPESSGPVVDSGSKASLISGSLSHVNAVDHQDRRPFEYPITTRAQVSSDLKKLLAFHPSPTLELLVNRVNDGPAVDPPGSARAEFWGFHLRKVSNVFEMVNTITKSVLEGIHDDDDNVMITDIVEQTSISIIDSLDRFNESGPFNHGTDDPFSIGVSPSHLKWRPINEEGILDEVEFHLFQQLSSLYLDSRTQPKHQPRVVLTGGSFADNKAIVAGLAQQMKEERPGCSVLRVDASDINAVSHAYSRIWIAAEHPSRTAFAETSLVYYLNWVYNCDWLMILDGIDGQTLLDMQLKGWLPSGLRGRLLLITQDASSCLSLLGQATEIRVPPSAEGEEPFPTIPALPPLRLEDFDIAIICVGVPTYKAICQLFPELRYEDPRDFIKYSGNPPWPRSKFVTYCAGQIYGRNIVLVSSGSYEEHVPTDIQFFFKRIQLALIVGTCSGLPQTENESAKGIFRGDVVIGSDVVHYRLSLRSIDSSRVIIPPSEHIRPLLDIVENNDDRAQVQKITTQLLRQLQAKHSTDINFAYPGVVEDKLFILDYPHIHRGSPDCSCGENPLYSSCTEAFHSSCDTLGCNNQYLIDRKMSQWSTLSGPHEDKRIQGISLHYGRIESCPDPVDGMMNRDKILSADSSILALMYHRLVAPVSLPFLTIQGIQDYGDVHNWAKWSNFAAATAASAAMAILWEHSHLAPWMVPFNKEAHFVGREKVLADVLSKISPGTNEHICQRTAIVGPEGIGKTRLALEAAYLFRRQHPESSVFWVSGLSDDDLINDFRAIGRRLRESRISEEDLQPGEDLTLRVKRELEGPNAGNWLLIIDNVNESIPNVLANWVPSNPNGSILLISRHEKSALRLGVPETNIIPVPTMDKAEAAELFRIHLGQDQLDNPAEMIDELINKTPLLPLTIIWACSDIRASGGSTQRVQGLRKFKDAATQLKLGQGEDRQETNQGEQTDEQTDEQPVKSQLVVTGETPTAVAPLSSEVEDEAKEGVWGYLVPAKGDRRNDPVIVLRKHAGETGTGVEEFNPKDKGKGTHPKAEGGHPETARPKPTFPGGFLIGRHPDCDLVIDDLTVSNRHCLLFSQNRGNEVVAVLEDYSSNGTFVNEAIVGRNSRRELNDYDEIAIVDKERFIFRRPTTWPVGSAFLQQYKILEKIGKGHFAEVFVCVEKSTGQRYAVKIFSKAPGMEERSKMEGLQQEAAILLGISHPHILSLKDVFVERNAVYMVLELVPTEELFNLIVKKQKLTEHETRKLFSQLFQAVKYLHDRNILHRDLKPENILSDEDLNIKLADFGLAKIVGEEDFTRTLCGTPSYVAPEILNPIPHRMYTKAVDVWSLGVILYICLCGFPPFSDELYSQESPYRLEQQIRGGRFDYPSPYWDSVGDPALDLIDSMIVVDPDKRFTVDQCIAHPWMTESPPSALSHPSRRGSRAEGHEVPRRGVVRERTLLSSMNNVDMSEMFRDFDQTSPPQEKKSAKAPESDIVAEPEELHDSKQPCT
ncbi:hypothetical protein F5Y14DRAFT_362482 [Nemania sp. NC0429]|nr:hypothetical protein F5Y14DRAFT_362482 [Nemania sp. NC0429]